MKKEKPTVKVIIDLTKKRKSDGLCPLYIQVLWNCKRAKESTGVYMDERDFKKGLYKKDKRLSKRLREIEARVDELLSDGKPFTPSEALEVVTVVPTVKIISELCRVKKLSPRTSTGYMTTHRSLEEYFGEGYRLSDLTLAMIQGYARTMRVSPSAMAFYLKDLKSLLGFAKDKGYVKENVMEKWRFKLDGFRDREKPKSRSQYEIKEYVTKWKESDEKGVKEAIGIWLSGYFFNGLALVDLMEVDWASVDEKFIEDGFYYSFTVERKKTREIAHVMTPVTELTKSLLELLRTRPWEGRSGYSKYINRNLKKIDNTLTYYQCRHSFASLLVGSRTPLNTIASMLGRSVNGLSTYIHRVTEEETLAAAAKVLVSEELKSSIVDETEVFESLID